MKVLDICSGLGGWSQGFLDRGHEVLRIDNSQLFWEVPHTLTFDIRMIEADDIGGKGYYDVILASPPCQGFSVQSIGRMWAAPGIPKHPTSLVGIMILRAVLRLITELSPSYWWLENPRGMMRKMPELEPFPRTTVTYCQYGEKRQKPTDLWGYWPDTWEPRPPCERGAPCHIPAPRGSVTGTQGMKGPEKALIPYQLSLEVCKSVELALS